MVTSREVAAEGHVGQRDGDRGGRAGRVGGCDGDLVLMVGVGGVLEVEGCGGSDSELAGGGVYREQGRVGASQSVFEGVGVGGRNGVAHAASGGGILLDGAGGRLALSEGRWSILGWGLGVSVDGYAP